LCLEGLEAEITFGSSCRFDDRKTAARVTWRQVRALREQGAAKEQPATLFEYTS
jgi:hypothetical protein